MSKLWHQGIHFFPLHTQLWLPNFTVVACPWENQNLRSKGMLSLSARDLCCLMTPSTFSGSGCSSTFDVPMPLCDLDAHSFTCWPVLWSLMANSLSPVSSLGTKRTPTLQWPLVSGSTTDVDWTDTWIWKKWSSESVFSRVHTHSFWGIL